MGKPNILLAIQMGEMVEEYMAIQNLKDVFKDVLDDDLTKITFKTGTVSTCLSITVMQKDLLPTMVDFALEIIKMDLPVLTGCYIPTGDTLQMNMVSAWRITTK